MALLMPRIAQLDSLTIRAIIVFVNIGHIGYFHLMGIGPASKDMFYSWYLALINYTNP